MMLKRKVRRLFYNKTIEIDGVSFFLAEDVKGQASEKVDQAKDKAGELASDAKKKGEGRTIDFFPEDPRAFRFF